MESIKDGKQKNIKSQMRRSENPDGHQGSNPDFSAILRHRPYGSSTATKTPIFSKMNPKNWKAYCQTTFNSLGANVINWGNPDFFRPITRMYYMGIQSCGETLNHLGLISEEAKNNPSERTRDHCLSPQFIGRMIMDNAYKYLSDYYVFENLFWLSCSTITVTKEENMKLRMLTKNTGIDYKVYVPTNLKYKHLGIKLYKKTGARWKDAVEYDDNIIPAPSDLLEYEKRLLV